jgi:hypothetical protein
MPFHTSLTLTLQPDGYRSVREIQEAYYKEESFRQRELERGFREYNEMQQHRNMFVSPFPASRKRTQAHSEDDVCEVLYLRGLEFDPADPEQRAEMLRGIDYGFRQSIESVPRRRYESLFGPQDAPVRVAEQLDAHELGLRQSQSQSSASATARLRQSAGYSGAVPQIPEPVTGENFSRAVFGSLGAICGGVPDTPRPNIPQPTAGSCALRVYDVDGGEGAVSATPSLPSPPGRAETDGASGGERRQGRSMPLRVRDQRQPRASIMQSAPQPVRGARGSRRRRERSGAREEGCESDAGTGAVARGWRCSSVR